jgi:hypothetical protein
LVKHLVGNVPKEFFISSPFHDAGGEICRRLASQWPKAQLEFLVQQNYTNLAVKPLMKLRRLRLYELHDSSRRIHAKLLAWRHGSGGGCLVGSANFTTAAFDGRNIETCLLISDAGDLVESLFDRSLSKRPLAFDDFVPGDAESPEAEGTAPLLRLSSALLTDANQLRVSYSHHLDPPPDSLRLAVRTPGETHPRASISIPKKPRVTESVLLPESALADSHGTLLASLIAEVAGERMESLPVWIIQESRLTYEPGEGSSSPKGKIEDTGEGLAEFLDELGRRDGLAAVVDYLQHLNIRFHGGGEGGVGQRKFRVRVRDPFHDDRPPDWLIEAKTRANDLEEAIYEFVERHERKRLRKHASMGNINGMGNFLDIFNTLVRLLYVYYKRGIVKRGQLIGRICTLLELATIGKLTEEEQFDGYLCKIFDRLGGDEALLQEVCDETNYLAEVRAALLIVQSIRFDASKTAQHGPKANRPREALPTYARAVAEAIRICGLSEPKPKDVQRALEDYRMFTEGEIAQLAAES